MEPVKPRMTAGFLIIAIAGVLLSWFGAVDAPAGQEPWSLVGFTKYRDAVFVTMAGAAYPSPNVVRVWTKIAPSEKSKYHRQITRELKKAGKPLRGLSYTEILNEIDCAGGKLRLLKIVYFNRQGGVIHAASGFGAAWKEIYPGSLWEELRKAACTK